ncbi:hypothetical protein L596_011700 [Steinernema carpocapsae]|uniref:Uncharacterized protein n=1 Tax=Steinernema carpocapsae TaxID=34508 RepID=A0A4U5NVP1_STECR|nr:hypothetical protein L596_011700 [Steinernema carpocapsae]
MVTVVLSVVVRIDLDLCKKMLEPKSFTHYNLPCLVGTVILFISYTACIHQLVTYRSKALSRQQARKKKQVLGAVLFFTPVTLVYIVNFGVFQCSPKQRKLVVASRLRHRHPSGRSHLHPERRFRQRGRKIHQRGHGPLRVCVIRPTNCCFPGVRVVRFQGVSETDSALDEAEEEEKRDEATVCK